MRYALAVDGRDFDALRDCFTPDAHAKYSDWFDDSGVDKIIPFVSGVAHFEVTQHFFGQSLIEVRGDEADARTYSNNHHFYRGDDGQRYARVQGNLYTERFVRRSGEWRIADLTPDHALGAGRARPPLAPPRLTARHHHHLGDARMNFTWDEKDLAFREEADTFCRENIPPWFRGHFASSDDDEKLFAKDFCKKLGERGWLTMAWPKEYGGADAPIWTQMQLKDLMESHREPRGPQYMNLNWIGPSIMLFGTDEQKQYHLSRMTAGDVVWCQGFSEPDSGSDLASLQTRAVRDGDDYVINGQKIWTSNAESAEFCFLLARTDPDVPKHGGISVFLIPMDTPGLTVRKIRSMVGYGNINEVFLDDVRAPRSTMLGNENEGWHVITAALNFERIGHAAHAALDDVIDYAKSLGRRRPRRRKRPRPPPEDRRGLRPLPRRPRHDLPPRLNRRHRRRPRPPRLLDHQHAHPDDPPAQRRPRHGGHGAPTPACRRARPRPSTTASSNPTGGTASPPPLPAAPWKSCANKSPSAASASPANPPSIRD